jgi:hypothetical protein
MILRNLLYFLLLFSAVSCSQDVGNTDSQRSSKQGPAQVGPASADPTSSAEKASEEELARMNAVLELSDQENANLKAAFQASNEALAQWRTEKGAKLAEFEQQMKLAAKNRDLAGVRRAKAQVDPLSKELRDLVRKHKSLVRNALSPEHQLAWDAHQLAERILEVMQPLNLSDQQIAQIRTDSLAAARESVNEINPSAAGFMNLEQVVELNVLTDEQRRAYQDVKKKKPLRSLK